MVLKKNKSRSYLNHLVLWQPSTLDRNTHIHHKLYLKMEAIRSSEISMKSGRTVEKYNKHTYVFRTCVIISNSRWLNFHKQPLLLWWNQTNFCIYLCTFMNTHIFINDWELEPHIWMHKGNVEVKFHTYAIFVWNINERWPPLCNIACWKCLQCWTHYGLFDLLSTWGQRQNVSSRPRRKEKKQLSSALSFVAFSKML
jgi:hypothetical protein